MRQATSHAHSVRRSRGREKHFQCSTVRCIAGLGASQSGRFFLDCMWTFALLCSDLESLQTVLFYMACQEACRNKHYRALHGDQLTYVVTLLR